MGRNVAGSLSTVQLIAGAAINQNDVVQIGADGKAFPVVTSDYAAANNIASTTNFLTGASTGYATYSRPPVYRDSSTGNIFLVTADATGQVNTRVSKFNATGVLMSSIVLSITTCYQPQICALSNGNLLVTVAGGTTNLSFAIVDTNLNIIKAVTNIGTLAYCYYDAIALSGGGFMASFLVAGGLQKLAVYDNSGNVVTAAATVQTWTGTAGAVGAKLVELSNLNVALVCYSGFSTTIGSYLGVYSANGTQVQALTNIDTGYYASIYYPEVSVMPGYIAINWITANTTFKVAVYSNAGVLQGSQTSFTTSTNGTTQALTKLVTDNTSFYLLWYPLAGSGNWNISKITTAGAVTNYLGVGGAIAGAGFTIDAVVDNGKLVASHSNGVNGYFFVIGLSGMTLDIANNSSTIGTYTKILAVGDASFLAAVVDNTGATGKANVIKYVNTAIIGVAQASAAAGSSVNINPSSGAFTVNSIRGSSVKAFDHSATNVYGNKGSLLTNGAIMKGM